MNKKYRHIILLIILMVSVQMTGVAQKNANKGDRYFDLNLFTEAIKYYELEASNGKDREYKNYAKKQLAECYRIIGEFEEAEKAYRKVLKSKKNREDPINFLNYGKSLKSSAKFEEAKVQFEEFIKLSPDDPRGPMYLQSCDSAQKWLDANLGKTVKNLEAINSIAPDFAPAFSSPGKVVFTSSREGSKRAFISFNGGMDIDYLDLYEFNMSDLSSESGVEIRNIKGLNTAKHEGPAAFSKDGKEVYFTQTVKGIRDKRTNEVINTLQVFYSKYDDSTQLWSEPVSAFPFNSSEYSVGHPSLSPDGNTIYFMSDMPKGEGGTDIYFCKKDENGEWTFPVNAGKKVNTFGYELYPYIADDGTLYFSSNGHPGMGQLDIFSSTFKNGQWGNVLNMQPPVNSIGDDFGVVLDGKAKRGFFSSDRFNGMGAEDIYSFAEEEPVELIIGKDFIQIKNTKIFDGLSYKAKDSSGNSIDIIDSLGFFMIPVKEKVVYEISAKKSIFSVNKFTVSLESGEGGSKKLYLLSDKNDFKIYLKQDLLNTGKAETIILKSDQFTSGENKLTKPSDGLEYSLSAGSEVLIEY